MFERSTSRNRPPEDDKVQRRRNSEEKERGLLPESELDSAYLSSSIFPSLSLSLSLGLWSITASVGRMTATKRHKRLGWRHSRRQQLDEFSVRPSGGGARKDDQSWLAEWPVVPDEGRERERERGKKKPQYAVIGFLLLSNGISL